MGDILLLVKVNSRRRLVFWVLDESLVANASGWNLICSWARYDIVNMGSLDSVDVDAAVIDHPV
jgi:hypothetical protein